MAEYIKRIDLGDGDWADVTTRPTHNRVNRLYRAWMGGSDDRAGYLDLMGEVILSLTVAWSVRGESGSEEPLTKEGLGNVPFEKVRDLFAAVKEQSTAALAAADPKP